MVARSVVEEQEEAGKAYIDAIILRASVRAVTSASVALKSMTGHIPDAEIMMENTAAGMMIPTSGRAMRLVSRKCMGKVPKYR